jgi:hypothetical protein
MAHLLVRSSVIALMAKGEKMMIKTITASFVAVLALLSAGGAAAQPARELTFFSNPGYSGARFTVTGPRTILNLPFVPRSGAIQGGGRWELCANRNYQGPCVQVAGSERDLRLPFQAVASIRPLGGAVSPAGWQELGRLNVRDHADTDTLRVRNQGQFREIRVCAERNTVRIRRAEVQLDGRQWQRLFLPLALDPGRCSQGIGLLGGSRRISAVRFDYEAWSAGWRSGTMVVSALPAVERQPR